MNFCPKKPPSTWREVIKEMYHSAKKDEVALSIMIMWGFLLAIFVIMKLFTV